MWLRAETIEYQPSTAAAATAVIVEQKKKC